MLARTIADQSPAELGGRASVLWRQKRDHIRLDELLHQLEAAEPAEQPRVLLDIYRLVFPHAFAEEAVLWPVLRRLSPDGEALTLQVEVEHQQINELVTKLEGLPPRGDDHARLLARIVTLLREDVRDEEDALLPRLQEKLTPNQLRLLGLAWEAVRRIAPTRAHPVVARRPFGNVLSALPLSVLDRSRDRIEARLHRRAGRAPALSSVAHALARTSHAVEYLPGMQQGERKPTRVEGGDMGARRALAATVLTVAVLGVAYARRRHRAA